MPIGSLKIVRESARSKWATIAVPSNALYYGDNLTVLRESVAAESVDLVYLDPPFNSQATYNLLFRSPSGVGSQAQIEVFEDTWHWGPEAEDAFDQVIRSGNTDVADMLRAMRSCLGENDMMAYLAMMGVRLLELHRVLRRTGTLYLHCDPTASHYLKVLLDAVFGAERFVSEIVWQRTNARATTGRWPRVHDTLLQYSKSDSFTFFPLRVTADERKMPHTLITGEDGKKYQTYELTAPGATKDGESGKPWLGYDPAKYGRHWANKSATMDAWDAAGLIHWPVNDGFPRRKDSNPFDAANRRVVVGDVWTDIDRINQSAGERLGYPTQKPVSLLERIVNASSKPGDVVLDPFCGCGAAIHVAQKLGRSWIGIDVTHLAISLIERRLKDAFSDIAFEVIGTPTDLDGARDLALRDKYQFQWWALSLIDAQPFAGKKKGADGGIDGLIYFRSDSRTIERAIVSVKGGDKVGVPMIRDLKGVLEREKAPIGVFLTLAPPTGPMKAEAASAGFYALGDRRYQRLQIITIGQALGGRKPAIPLVDAGATFKRAVREKTETQAELDI